MVWPEILPQCLGVTVEHIVLVFGAEVRATERLCRTSCCMKCTRCEGYKNLWSTATIQNHHYDSSTSSTRNAHLQIQTNTQLIQTTPRSNAPQNETFHHRRRCSGRSLLYRQRQSLHGGTHVLRLQSPLRWYVSLLSSLVSFTLSDKHANRQIPCRDRTRAIQQKH